MLKDKKLGDQRTTLLSVHHAQEFYKSIGITTPAFVNPHVQNSPVDYIKLDEDTVPEYTDGEFIFLLLINGQYANVDFLLQILRDKNRQPAEKLERMTAPFNIDYQNLPLVQRVIQDALTKFF